LKMKILGRMSMRACFPNKTFKRKHAAEDENRRDSGSYGKWPRLQWWRRWPSAELWWGTRRPGQLSGNSGQREGTVVVETVAVAGDEEEDVVVTTISH